MHFSPRRHDFFPLVKQDFPKVIVEPTAEREQLARSESGTGCGRFDNSLVSPSPRNALDLTVWTFYEIIQVTPFPQRLSDRHAPAT